MIVVVIWWGMSLNGRHGTVYLVNHVVIYISSETVQLSLLSSHLCRASPGAPVSPPSQLAPETSQSADDWDVRDFMRSKRLPDGL